MGEGKRDHPTCIRDTKQISISKERKRKIHQKDANIEESTVTKRKKRRERERNGNLAVVQSMGMKVDKHISVRVSMTQAR